MLRVGDFWRIQPQEEAAGPVPPTGTDAGSMMVMNLTEYAQEVEVWLDDHVDFQTAALAGMVGNKNTHHFENIPAMSFCFFWLCAQAGIEENQVFPLRKSTSLSLFFCRVTQFETWHWLL